MPFNLIKANGFDLTDNYAFTGTVTGAGDPSLVRLGGGSATGVNLGDISFDLFTTNYDVYYVTFILNYVGQTIGWLRLRSSGSYLTGSSYRQTLSGKKSDGSASAIDYNSSTYFQISGTFEDGNTHNSIAGNLLFFKPAVSSKTTQITANILEMESSALTVNRTGSFMYLSAGNHSGFGFMGSAQNIDEYHVQVFGVKQS
jgi:hypothetical protein